MTLRIPAKVLIHVWSYDFYDMTLSTGKQRRHMIMIGLGLRDNTNITISRIFVNVSFSFLLRIIYNAKCIYTS